MPFPSVQTIEINGKRLDTGFDARVTESLLVAIDLTLALAPALAGLGRERDRAMERERGNEVKVCSQQLNDHGRCFLAVSL